METLTQIKHLDSFQEPNQQEDLKQDHLEEQKVDNTNQESKFEELEEMEEIKQELEASGPKKRSPALEMIKEESIQCNHEEDAKPQSEEHFIVQDKPEQYDQGV